MYLPHSILLCWNQKESMIKTMFDLFLRIISPNSIPANSNWVPREGLTQTQSNYTVTSDLGYETVVVCTQQYAIYIRSVWCVNGFLLCPWNTELRHFMLFSRVLFQHSKVNHYYGTIFDYASFYGYLVFNCLTIILQKFH